MNTSHYSNGTILGGGYEPTALTRYKTPSIPRFDNSLAHFIKWVRGGNATSAIREYPGNLYFASVGTGATCVGPPLFFQGERQFRKSCITKVRRSYNGADLDWIFPMDSGNSWLPGHQQLKLVMDHNLMNPTADSSPFWRRLSTTDEKNIYLKHQRTYLLSLAAIEMSMDKGKTPQFNTPERRCEIFQEALQRIDQLFETVSTSAQIRLSHSSQYMEQILPFWVKLKKTIYPTLQMRKMEPEYALYALRTRLRVEQLRASGKLANLPDLSSELKALPIVRVL
ncbi:hypothetical protein B0H13DRAFT_1862867 [Mycena leptocephala]|nr:hypothetical protein B0H13DRAFT_1862867 [Mycena leptocephala]